MNLAITGATSGIGTETVKALAPRFKQIFLLVRNTEKAQNLVNQWKGDGYSSSFHIIPCDLANLATVAHAAEKITQRCQHLDVLINNAGGIFRDRQFTENGLERSFSINHLGHFLLTKQLLPLLFAAGKARIINVSSDAHRIARPDIADLQATKSYSALQVYANVKLYSILFTKSLVERYGHKGIYAFALHPGMVKTNFGSEFTGWVKWGMKIIKPFLESPAQGAKTPVFLASDPSVLQANGGYFKRTTLSKTSKAAASIDLRRWLWQESERLLHMKGFS